eukprot:TRINITY_DN5640_c0_g1_i1.p1 TRINITY_DN5640_c0_g1~~TRINITY_DN5640_c0_g1_i1.p1  ORF type:complete len:137 (-),score=18.12 TRINITY_DN5640_c0_g1_i1:3-413(-)
MGLLEIIARGLGQIAFLLTKVYINPTLPLAYFALGMTLFALILFMSTASLIIKRKELRRGGEGHGYVEPVRLGRIPLEELGSPPGYERRVNRRSEIPQYPIVTSSRNSEFYDSLPTSRESVRAPRYQSARNSGMFQ